ncbi:MAG: hypothetical protein ACLTSG_09415 [Lachnospiraceae bacterium]
MPATAKTAKVCIVKGMGAGTLNQAQSETSAAESAIYAMSRVFAAPGRGPRALSRRPSRRRRRRP